MRRVSLAVFLSLLALPAPAAPEVIELTQVPCQFLESEKGVNRGYRSRSAADCEAVNGRPAAQRLGEAKVIRLKPGRYSFRVTNRDVPYELGFWLRGAGALERVRLPSVSGGRLHAGTTRDYAIDLKPGEYVYSCPLNPTPDYRQVVK
jgi:hypothetical protein